MKYMIYGGAGFIGTNLIKSIASNPQNEVIVVDKQESYFKDLQGFNFINVVCIADVGFPYIQFDHHLDGVDVVYHLMSTSMPSNTNSSIANEINDNIAVSIQLLDACVKKSVKKIVFISSGGTVYGRHNNSPIGENEPNHPITAYGVQKLTIEKLVHLYFHIYGLKYRIIRLSNPYGFFQRPNGKLGAVTTFTFSVMNGKKIIVYGDGSVIRDYIFIDDAVHAILNIENYDKGDCLFNVGSGCGHSLNDIINCIGFVLKRKPEVEYRENRSVDVPVNILDVTKYEKIFGKCAKTDLNKGIKRTYEFLKENY